MPISPDQTLPTASLAPAPSGSADGRDPVLEAVPAGVAVFDAQRRLRRFNAAFSELFGLDPNWLAGAPDFLAVIERLREHRMLPEEADPRAFRAAQMALFQTSAAPRSELLHLPDGRTLKRVAHSHPAGGVILVFEDQTRRYALEREHNAHGAVRQATLDSLQDGIAAFGSDGRLKLSNLAFAALWDLSADDLAGEPHVTRVAAVLGDRLAGDADRPSDPKPLIGAVLERRQRRMRLMRQDGRVIECAMLPLPDGAVLTVHRDISDGVRVESALAERDQALRTADLAKTAFIANVSFEVRAPLNTVVSFAELLTEETFGALNPRQKLYAEAIRKAAGGVAAVLGDILELAAIKAGQTVLEPADVDVHDLSARALALLRERARRKGVILDLDCLPDIGCVRADGARLGQVLHHLLDNAVEHTPARGTVRLTATRVRDRLRLIVRDTGSGIAKADRERIFEPFAKGGQERSQEAPPGAGLGLTLVRRLIALHGGEVTLASTPGRGTTVTCDLPADGPGLSAVSARSS